MLFNSLAFAIFLPIVFCCYWNLPHKYRWAWLLLTSYYFYMSWNPKYIVLIVFTTVISYGAAICLERVDGQTKKKTIAISAVLLCLGILFYFKYFNFLSQSLCSLIGLFAIKLHPITVDVLLPVGISFYTFQTLSYVIDVYKGRIKAERHLGYFALFVSFFPQLVAGPIERPFNLLPQIKVEHKFVYNQATYGLKLMAWGFFKKLVIADYLSTYVQLVFNDLHSFQGFALVLASFFFTVQIYCDFSGYSDIAVGTAKLFGINLTTNFKQPYLSRSIKEFWSRWHISLSTWFRDYVYIPLGGNKVSKTRHFLNLLLTFLVSGLWHGANWTFVFWGGVHGVGVIVEDFLRKFINRLFKDKGLRQSFYNSKTIYLFRVLLVFCFCNFAWIFFVSNSLENAFWCIFHMFDGLLHNPLSYFNNGIESIGLDKTCVLYLIVVLGMLFTYDIVSLQMDIIKEISEKKLSFRWLIYIIIVFIIISSFYSGKIGYNEFIYFQF